MVVGQRGRLSADHHDSSPAYQVLYDAKTGKVTWLNGNHYAFGKAGECLG
jgi:hypothetical protein